MSETLRALSLLDHQPSSRRHFVLKAQETAQIGQSLCIFKGVKLEFSSY